MFKTPMKRPSRTVIVTGGTAGVGRAIACRFAQSGDRVGVIAREAQALEGLRKELTSLGAECATEAIDVADAAAVFAAAQRLEARLGKIDVWINDAMETVFSTVAELSPEEFRRVTEVTYLGFVYGTMAALRTMRPRRRGRIIQIGSALAYRGIPLQAAYCGAKHAIRGFTDSLRAELLHERSDIRISIVELPAVNTPQFDWARVHLSRTPRPMGRPVEPGSRGRPSRGQRILAGVLARVSDDPHDHRQRGRTGLPGSIPGAHRVRRPADGNDGRCRQAGQSRASRLRAAPHPRLIRVGIEIAGAARGGRAHAARRLCHRRHRLRGRRHRHCRWR